MVLLAITALLSITAVVLPTPDLGDAWQFLSGEVAGYKGEAAVAAGLSWVVLLTGSVFLLLTSLRRSRASCVAWRHPWVRALALFVCGVVLLGVGALRHTSPAFSLCCGNVQEARDLAR